MLFQLVSTSQEYLEKLANNLFIVREVQMEKRTYHLKVHTCKNIIDVLENMPEEMYVDYIIFVLETTVGNCLTDVKFMFISEFMILMMCSIYYKGFFFIYRWKITYHGLIQVLLEKKFV